jgi:nitrile hydratase subunit alpha
LALENLNKLSRDPAARVAALESVLIAKGYVDPQAVDAIIDTRAWTEPDFKAWLLRDATAAIGSMGYTGRQGEHMTVLENTPEIHNMVVCTLCSCYPWAVLGLPPVWYKSPAYRSKAVIDPLGVLKDFGRDLPSHVRIKVWDSTAELRYLVLPMQPEASKGLTGEALEAWVNRDSMIGTGFAEMPIPAGSGA